MYGCFSPVHWFNAQLNSRIWERMSAPYAASRVVGILQPADDEQQHELPPAVGATCQLAADPDDHRMDGAPRRLCAASLRWRSMMPNTVVGVPDTS